MAIAFDYNFEGLLVPNAYVRIDHIAGGKNQGWGAMLGVYSDSTHTHRPITTIYKDVPYVEGSIIHTQIYDAIKQDYPLAVDC